MPIVVENVEVVPEPAPAPQAGSQAPAPAPQPKPAEIEKLLRCVMERLRRVEAS